MGIVYLALRASDGTPVALKSIIPEIIPSEKELAQFLREDFFEAAGTGCEELHCSAGELARREVKNAASKLAV